MKKLGKRLAVDCSYRRLGGRGQNSESAGSSLEVSLAKADSAETIKRIPSLRT